MGKFKYIEHQEYKYKIIPEKRVVVCECYIKLNWYKLPYHIWENIPSNICEKVYKNMNNSYPEFKIRAVAKAHPNDVFNIETGKRIAKSKVNIKLYRILENCVKLMATDLYNTAYFTARCKESIYELRLREQDHLKQLSK